MRKKTNIPRKVSQAPKPIKSVSGLGSGLPLTRPPGCPSLENDDNHKIDWNHWKKLGYWRISDAIILSFGHEPPLIERADDDPFMSDLHKCNDLREYIDTLITIPKRRKELGHSTSDRSIQGLEGIVKRVQLIQSCIEDGTLNIHMIKTS